MAIMEHFGNPRGLLGRFILSGMNTGHTPMAKWGFTQFSVPKDEDAVDIGCGGGLNIKRLLERSGKGRVYGVDISPLSVEKSKAVNKKDLGNRCEVYQGSAEKLPFSDASLRLATAFETIYFWKNIDSCFREIRRVLKKGGQFIVVNDPGDMNKRWEQIVPNMTVHTPQEVAALMARAGFTDIRVSTKQHMFCVIGNA